MLLLLAWARAAPEIPDIVKCPALPSSPAPAPPGAAPVPDAKRPGLSRPRTTVPAPLGEAEPATVRHPPIRPLATNTPGIPTMTTPTTDSGTRGQRESAAARAQGAPPDHDRAWRRHRHGPVHRLRRGDRRGRSRRRAAGLPGDRPDGLFHHDQPGRTGHLHAGVRLLLHLCLALRGSGLRLRAGLDLLVQLGHRGGRGRGGGAAGHGLLVPGFARMDLERGLPGADLRPERLRRAASANPNTGSR